MDRTRSLRSLLKADLWAEWREWPTDQRKRVPPPPLQQPTPEQAQLLPLTPPDALHLGEGVSVAEAITHRRSHRQFQDTPLTLDEVSFLLWATQGVRHVFEGRVATLRTVPSGGARHPFETYLWVNRVTGLKPGLYRYLPLEHQLCVLRLDDGLAESVVAACGGQAFAGQSALTFIWTCIPYRTEWRYAVVSAKIIAQDSGHLCQNLYLAAEAIGVGTCAIGAYEQSRMDALLGVDGEDEFVVYVAPVGRVR
jgi:SagB-type dehydrogenase family enzyme